MSNSDRILVTGAGGFVGGHLVRNLIARGYTQIRAVDIKPFDEWFQLSPETDNRQLDLRDKGNCLESCRGVDCVYNLASDMGGMGFIELNKALCTLSVLINAHMLMAAKENGVRRFFFSSSACVYPADKQKTPDVTPLKESDAYPAEPEDGYGFEKLFSEQMCRHFMEDFGLETRVARYHNVYGPNGNWRGGREKAPAAICRKIIQAKLEGGYEIEIWGDGEQTRSFTFIDDAITGTRLIMDSDYRGPLNLGSDQLVTINQLVDIIENISGIKLKRRYNLDAPKGVRGRNSDNTLIREQLGWAPSVKLEDGMETTYRWIYDQMIKTQGR